MDPLKPYWKMTREELMKLDHILLGEALDTPESMMRAVWDFDLYWKENPADFESTFNDWLPTQFWYRFDTQTDAFILRTNYFLWKLSEGKIKKQFRKVLPRVLQTRRTGDEQRR